MRSIFIGTILTCLYLFSSAQTKPELPLDFFSNWTHTLPKDFDYNDSIQLQNEIKKLANELMQIQANADKDYQISDSTVLFGFADGQIVPFVILQKNAEAISNIYKVRSLNPSPYYATPYWLSVLAYTKAAQQQTDDGSKSFATAFTNALKTEFEKLNPDFKSDIINQNKGVFTSSSTELSWKNLSRIFDQVIQNNNNQLNYGTALNILSAYWAYSIKKKYQPGIENLLYSMEPAKVNEEKVKIPMRDGIHLSAYVYRNINTQEKLPAIISLSPYPSGFEAVKGNVFATNGYIFVYADTRGRRESEGTFSPYENDAQDFYDIIDWVSKQPWCNGKVATSGGSYLGFTQWQTIRKEYKHPALKAINPMVAVGFGVDFPRSSNCFYPYMLQWATYVSGKELNNALFDNSDFWNSKQYELYKKRIPFYKLDSVASLPNPSFQKWVSHPDFDSYWKNILPKKEDYAAIDIPVFSITGYYDADQNGAMFYYNNHMKYGTPAAKKNHYLLIGPYEHIAAQWQPFQVQNGERLEEKAQIPIYKYVIWWFDWVLKGKKKPEFIKDNITYFETGNNTWKGTSSFNKLTTDSIVLYLNPTVVKNNRRENLQSLSIQKPATEKIISYKQDIAMAFDSAFLFAQPATPYDDSLYMTSAYNLMFESSPLEKDIVLSNEITSAIFMKLNVPDADFDWNIYEITPDGKSKIIGSNYIRVRYRNGGDKPMLAKPGEIIKLNFEDAYIFIKKISKGSKLRLEFELTNRPYFEKNYGFGGIVSHETTDKPRIIEAKILTGGKYASKLVLPIVKQ